MHIPALIFARMDSSRLPCKAMMRLGHAPVLARVVHRLSSSREVDGIVICTSDRAVDDPITEVAEKMKTGLFRGAAEDVLGRALACAHDLRADAVVRISGDSPFMDAALVDQVVRCYRDTAPDIATNVHPRTYPAGMSVEVISTGILEKLDRDVQAMADREHVTKYLYDHADGYRIENVAAPASLRDVDLALDTEDDFALAKWLANEVADDADLNTIIDAARRFGARQSENVT
jgi:spore coat polysaccharide biosynthesis protein SpsF (cytidylyltransferase family)